MTPSDRFFSAFYTDPDPRVALGAFVEFAPQPRAPNTDNLYLHFARAAQLVPGFRQALVDLADRERGFAEAVQTVLRAADDPAFPTAATIALTTPGDLDFLWGEFLLTGNEAPVQRILGVLDREDRMLAQFTAWVAEAAWMPWTRSAKAARRERLSGKGILTDVGAPALGNRYDLDLTVWKLMSGGFKIHEEVPFPVSQELVLHLAMKGAACWSTQSNARQHAPVARLFDAYPRRDRLPSFVG